MSSPTHFVVICAPFFGHARPTIAFAMNLLNEHPNLYITYVCSGTSSIYFTPAFDREIALYDLQDEPRSRLKVKLLGEGAKDTSMEQLISFFTELPKFLGPLLSNSKADSLRDVFQHIPRLITVEPVTLGVTDMLDVIMPASPYPSLHIPVLAFFPTNASLVNFYWIRRAEYPETYWIPLWAEAEEEVASGAHGDAPVMHVAYKMWARESDILARTPSLPPMFNHELNPQTDALASDPSSWAVGQSQFCKSIIDHVPKVAGFIIHTSPIMEPGEVEDMEKTSPQHTFLQIGPQYPAAWWAEGIPQKVQILSAEDQQTLSFLDEMETRYGRHSVLYISFGTTYLPTERPQLFDALIKTILAADPPLPFVWAGGRTNPILTEKQKEAIAKSGRGLLAGFVPQQALLKHSATGFYLCHAGSNSISEAFLNSVPMVLWPYTIDQPLIANQLSTGLKLAFELLQVRNGNSVGRSTYRGTYIHGTQEAVEEEMSDVWTRMRGEEGVKMRENVASFRKAMVQDYQSGKAKRAMSKFTDYMKE